MARYVPTSVHSPSKLALSPLTTSSSSPLATPTSCTHANLISALSSMGTNFVALHTGQTITSSSTTSPQIAHLFIMITSLILISFRKRFSVSPFYVLILSSNPQTYCCKYNILPALSGKFYIFLSAARSSVETAASCLRAFRALLAKCHATIKTA